MLLSTEPSADTGQQLDRPALIAQLEQALALARGLGETAGQQQAEGTDTQAQAEQLAALTAWQQGSNVAAEASGGGAAMIALSGQAGVALASPKTISLASGEQLAMVGQQDANLSVGQNLRLRAARAISLFAQGLGMKLIAAAGKIHIQAQSDTLEISAAKRLHLYSLEEVLIEAPKVTIKSQGAEALFGGNAITTRTQGPHAQYAGDHLMEGPAGGNPQLSMPKDHPGYDQNVILRWVGTQDPITNQPYRLHLSDGRVLEGTTDEQGRTQQLQHQLQAESYTVELLPKAVKS